MSILKKLKTEIQKDINEKRKDPAHHNDAKFIKLVYTFGRVIWLLIRMDQLGRS